MIFKAKSGFPDKLFCRSLRLVRRYIGLGKPFIIIEAYMLSDQKSVDKVSRRQKLILIPRHTFGTFACENLSDQIFSIQIVYLRGKK